MYLNILKYLKESKSYSGGKYGVPIGVKYGKPGFKVKYRSANGPDSPELNDALKQYIEKPKGFIGKAIDFL